MPPMGRCRVTISSRSARRGPSVIESRAIITNISSSPNPKAIPFTSDSANVVWKRDVRQDLKATRRPSASVKALNALSEQITTSQSSINSLLLILLCLQA